MKTRKTYVLLSRVSLILPLLMVSIYGSRFLYRKGFSDAERELKQKAGNTELQVIPLQTEDSTIVFIRQRLGSDSDGFKNRVRIDTEGYSELRINRLLEAGWSDSTGFSEQISLWQVSNESAQTKLLNSECFLNLPAGFSFKSDYYSSDLIPIDPES